MDEDTQDDLSGEQADLRREAKRKQKEADADFRWLLGSRRGRRIVWRTLEEAGVFQSVFNQNAMSMAFAEGNRNRGLRTLSDIHRLAPEAYGLMVTENATDDARDTDRRSSTSH